MEILNIDEVEREFCENLEFMKRLVYGEVMLSRQSERKQK